MSNWRNHYPKPFYAGFGKNHWWQRWHWSISSPEAAAFSVPHMIGYYRYVKIKRIGKVQTVDDNGGMYLAAEELAETRYKNLNNNAPVFEDLPRTQRAEMIQDAIKYPYRGWNVELYVYKKEESKKTYKDSEAIAALEPIIRKQRLITTQARKDNDPIRYAAEAQQLADLRAVRVALRLSAMAKDGS